MGNTPSAEAEAAAPVENTFEVKWTPVPLSGVAIEPREGHIAVSDENKLYIFGGGGGEEQFNELLQVNLDTGVVAKVQTTGNEPTGRTGAAAQMVDGKIWIIGGLSTASRGWVNDVFCFDTEENKWSFVIPSGDRPTPRDKLASCKIGNKIYLFGGFGPRKKATPTEGEGNAEMDEEEEELAEEEEEEEEDEDKPKVPDFDWFNDVFVLDTETQEWITLPTTGTKPSPRCAVGLCALDENQILVFGGRDAQQRKNDSYVLNIETREWTHLLHLRGRIPDSRSFHSCTRVGGGVVMFGGMSINNSHFSDVHVLSYVGEEGQLAWLQPTVTGTAPSARGFHSSTAVGEAIYVFGGSSGFDPELMCVTRFCKDLYKLELTEKPPKEQE